MELIWIISSVELATHAMTPAANTTKLILNALFRFIIET